MGVRTYKRYIFGALPTEAELWAQADLDAVFERGVARLGSLLAIGRADQPEAEFDCRWSRIEEVGPALCLELQYQDHTASSSKILNPGFPTAAWAELLRGVIVCDDYDNMEPEVHTVIAIDGVLVYNNDVDVGEFSGRNEAERAFFMRLKQAMRRRAEQHAMAQQT